MPFVIFLIALFSFSAPTSEVPLTDDGPKKKVVVKTSAICGMCKTTIEKALYKLEGVRKANLDIITKKVKVKYDASLVDEATIRQAISAAGYDADEIPARPKAYEALPACCKKGSSCDKPKDE